MKIIRRLTQSFLSFIITHPKSVLTVFILLTIMSGSQIRDFKIDASPDTLLMRNNIDYIRSKEIDRRFSTPEFLIIAYKPERGGIFSGRTFSVLKELSERIRQLDRVESVRSILNVPVLIQTNTVISQNKELSKTSMEHNDYDISLVKKEFTNHPVYENLLVNKTQTATALQVIFKRNDQLKKLDNEILDLQKKSLHKDLTGPEEKYLFSLMSQAGPLKSRLEKQRDMEIETIKGIIKDYEDDADIYLGGVHALAYDLVRIIKHDLVLFGAGIAVIMCLVLFLIFRKIRWVLIPVLCCSCSVIMTMGLFALFELKTTVISSNFITLQLILNLALVIHLIVQYREYNVQYPELDQTELVQKTLFNKVTPSFYAGVTNAVGFGSLIFSEIQPVISFGWMMIIAMFISITISLILFPAVLTLFKKEPAAGERTFSRLVLRFFTWLSLRHPYPVLIAGLCILAVSAAGLFRLDVENSFINYFKKSTNVNRELSYIDREFGGTTPLDLVYTIAPTDKDRHLVITAKTVRMLHRIDNSLKKHEAVGKIMSLTNFFILAKEINKDKPLTEYEVTALYRTMPGSFRRDLIDTYYSPEHQQVRFNVRIKDTTEGLDRGKLITDIKEDMKTLDIHEDRFILTNLFILYEDILQQLFKSQIVTLGSSCAILMIPFFVLFRSVRIALIGIIPNIMSVVIVLGFMGWAGVPLDIMTITIASISLGITVDDMFHFISRYLEELKDNPESKAAHQTLFSVGYAMLYTALITIIGFSILAFSDFVPGIIFGLLTGLAMAITLVTTLSLLPALLVKFVKGAQDK